MQASTDLIVFDTDSVAPSHRFEYWNDFVQRRLLGVRLDSGQRDTYRGRIELHGLGNAALVFAQGDPCYAVRDAVDVANTRADMPRWLLVRANSPMRIRHCNRDEKLQPGDLILIDAQRPYMRDESVVDYTAFAMSAKLVKEWAGILEACAGQRFSCQFGWPRLLSSHIAGIGPDLMGSVRQTPASCEAFTSFLVSTLIKMLSQASRSAEHDVPSDTRSDRARRHLYSLMLLWIR